MASELYCLLSTIHSLLSIFYSPLSTLYSLLGDCVLSAARLHLTTCQLPHKDGRGHRSGSSLVLVLVELWRRRGLISCWDPCCLRSSLPRPRPRPHHLVEAQAKLLLVDLLVETYCRAHVTWHLVQLQLDASCGKLAACGSCSATPLTTWAPKYRICSCWSSATRYSSHWAQHVGQRYIGPVHSDQL